MYSNRRGMDKNHPGQNLLDKKTPDKTPRTETPVNYTKTLCNDILCIYAYTTKNWGVPRRVTYFRGMSQDV